MMCLQSTPSCSILSEYSPLDAEHISLSQMKHGVQEDPDHCGGRENELYGLFKMVYTSLELRNGDIM